MVPARSCESPAPHRTSDRFARLQARLLAQALLCPVRTVRPVSVPTSGGSVFITNRATTTVINSRAKEQDCSANMDDNLGRFQPRSGLTYGNLSPRRSGSWAGFLESATRRHQCHLVEDIYPASLALEWQKRGIGDERRDGIEGRDAT